jgi:hypothetical protein
MSIAQTVPVSAAIMLLSHNFKGTPFRKNMAKWEPN